MKKLQRIILVLSLAFGGTLAVAATSQAASDQTHYPITLRVGAVKTIIAHQPKRIISLSPSATEILFSIGAGKQVIAVDADSNFPTSAPTSKLDGFTPNVEAIAAYKPDLVILQSTAGKASQVAQQLEKLKISVLMEVTPSTLSDVYTEMTVDGQATNNQKKTFAKINSMKKAIAAAISSVTLKKPLSFFHELDNTGYSATSTTFIGQVYKSFGLINVADAAATADSAGYPQLTPEAIIGANPDLVFLADAQYGESPVTFAARPGFSTLAAVTNNHVIALPSDISSRWGPRLVQFYQIIANALKSVI